MDRLCEALLNGGDWKSKNTEYFYKRETQIFEIQLFDQNLFFFLESELKRICKNTNYYGSESFMDRTNYSPISLYLDP